MIRALDRFFFAFSAPLSIAVFRIMFGLTLLINVLLRLPHTEEYFTDLSGVPVNEAFMLLPEFFQPMFTWYPRTIEVALGFQFVMIAALVALIVGVFGRIGTRVMAFFILVCHLALLQRNYSIVYGADMVSTFWILGLCFMDSTERLSLRRWRYKLKKQNFIFEPQWSRILTSVGARLVQIQLCVIYMYTGFEKLKGGDWWDQTAVWKVLGNEQLMLADLSFLKNVPLVIGLLTWGTVLFEVYFPTLIWSKTTRKWILLSGWALHIGIALTMGLFIFSLTMMSAYLLFVDPLWLERALNRVKGAKNTAPRFGLRS